MTFFPATAFDCCFFGQSNLLNQSDCRYYIRNDNIMYKVSAIFNCSIITMTGIIIANLQNIGNLIGREENSTDRFVTVVALLYTVTKQQ